MSTVALQSDIATRWISANGTLVNLLFGAILPTGYPLLPRARDGGQSVYRHRLLSLFRRFQLWRLGGGDPGLAPFAAIKAKDCEAWQLCPEFRALPCWRNGYITSYQPYNFKGRVTDFPLTLEYGKKIDALRRRHREWLWDADFRDTLGAFVTANGTHRYAVFVAKTGKRAVVMVNQEQEKSITAVVQLPRPGRMLVATPERPDAQPASGTLNIPPRSAAVVMEQ